MSEHVEAPVVGPQVIDIRLVRRADGLWDVAVDGRRLRLPCPCPCTALGKLRALIGNVGAVLRCSEPEALAVLGSPDGAQRVLDATLSSLFGAIGLGPVAAADAALDAVPPERQA